MRTRILLAVGIALLAGCGASTADGVSSGAEGGSNSAAATTTPTKDALDGTQDYALLEEIVADLQDAGVDCSRFQEDARPPLLASKQGRCYIGAAEIVLQIYTSPASRDDGVDQLVGLAVPYGLEYCYIVGREDSPWVVNAGASPQNLPSGWRCARGS